MEIEDVAKENVSYLYARDPSIMAYNSVGLYKLKENLQNKYDDSSAELEKDNDCLKVFLRIKGNVNYENLYTIEGKTLTCKIPEGSHVLRNVKSGESITKKYSFSKIFGPKTTQIDMFNNVVKPKILAFINGKNSTIMTYGASGSGKTFTIVGNDMDPGLVPRSLEYLFRTIPKTSNGIKIKPKADGSAEKLNETSIALEKQKRHKILHACLATERNVHIRTYKVMQKRLSTEPAGILSDAPNVTVGIWVSFAEIYNEHLYDLLTPTLEKGKQRLKLKLGSVAGRTFIRNLSSINVTSGLEAYQILQYGLHNLNYAATSINSNSSRSHSIFTIKMIQSTDVNDQTIVTYFNFCDLAGSERLKKTMNVGDRLKESNNINTSLMVLGRCISSIRTAQKNSDKQMVPFRESKLTQLFHKALLGLEDICMIVNINPSQDMFDESYHVLNFSAIAKQIIVQEQPIKVIRKEKLSRFSKYLQTRSTSIPPIIEEKEHSTTNDNDCIEKLREIICEREDELMTQKLEFEQQECELKQQIVERYEKIIADREQAWEEILRDKERCWASKANLWKQKCKEQNSQVKRRKVINLISDDEGTDEDESSDNNNKLKEEVALLKEELNKTKLINLSQTKLIETLKSENENLQMTLEDAEREYTNLMVLWKYDKKQSQIKTERIIELEEKVAEHEQHAIMQRQCNYTDNTDSDCTNKVLKDISNISTIISTCMKDMHSETENLLQDETFSAFDSPTELIENTVDHETNKNRLQEQSALCDKNEFNQMIIENETHINAISTTEDLLTENDIEFSNKKILDQEESFSAYDDTKLMKNTVKHEENINVLQEQSALYYNNNLNQMNFENKTDINTISTTEGMLTENKLPNNKNQDQSLHLCDNPNDFSEMSVENVPSDQEHVNEMNIANSPHMQKLINEVQSKCNEQLRDLYSDG